MPLVPSMIFFSLTMIKVMSYFFLQGNYTKETEERQTEERLHNTSGFLNKHFTVDMNSTFSSGEVSIPRKNINSHLVYCVYCSLLTIDCNCLLHVLGHVSSKAV